MRNVSHGAALRDWERHGDVVPARIKPSATREVPTFLVAYRRAADQAHAVRPALPARSATPTSPSTQSPRITATSAVWPGPSHSYYWRGRCFCRFEQG